MEFACSYELYLYVSWWPPHTYDPLKGMIKWQAVLLRMHSFPPHIWTDSLSTPEQYRKSSEISFEDDQFGSAVTGFFYIRCEMNPTSVGGEQQISISGGSQSPIWYSLRQDCRDAQKKYVMHCMTRISQQECRGILERYNLNIGNTFKMKNRYFERAISNPVEYLFSVLCKIKDW